MPFTLGPGEGPLSPFAPTAAPPGPPPPKTNDQGIVQNATIPGVDTYGPAALAAKTAYQKALAQINEQRSGALRMYGYLGDIDPTSGTLTNMRVDPNNPNGLFQEMLSQHATAQQAARAGSAARGLGHGGLAEQAITAEHKSFGADSANLGQQIMSQLEGLQGQQNDSETAMNDALYQAQLDAARNAIANQQFSTPDYGDATIPQYGDGSAYVPPLIPKTVKPPAKTPAPAPKPTAKKVTANKTGATTQKGRGVISIH